LRTSRTWVKSRRTTQGSNGRGRRIDASWDRTLDPTLQENNIPKGKGRESIAKLLAGRISCVVGLHFGAGGILFALLGASANVSAEAVGAALGVLGYFLDERWLGAATIVLGVVAVFFMAAASAGLIPGVAPAGHRYD
jgi:hypothetical protein